MPIEHSNLSGNHVGFKSGLGRVLIPAVFQYFMGILSLFVSLQVKSGIDKMIQYTLHKVRLIDKLFQASCINEIFIYLIVCLPVEANICSLDGNIQKLHYEMMANISSQLCSMKSGDIFFAGQTTRGREQ
mgnify:CR=1 FL=1